MLDILAVAQNVHTGEKALCHVSAGVDTEVPQVIKDRLAAEIRWIACKFVKPPV